MDQTVILDFTTRALVLVLVLSMPPILVATFVGLIVSLLQALTQIQEQTLGFAIKLICITVILMLTAHWMGGELLRFASYIFERFPSMTS
ncbi:MAG: EscS/YscS/HrcS family type III secretion system export apparatus protein [Verrucomicrobia bacterium GWF2_51_19]|nr:MAG: EscS/YscS/HrcS family type III secretion system export apparatus protein [Verrucomicrobia bacterium GWF2_51_19]HBA82843.1 EscS/YscS/HrcS family type III secretion system export apparatus protein [Verrucomicrobiota bacterium]